MFAGSGAGSLTALTESESEAALGELAAAEGQGMSDETGDDMAGSISAGDYFSFTISATDGFYLDLYNRAFDVRKLHAVVTTNRFVPVLTSLRLISSRAPLTGTLTRLLARLQPRKTLIFQLRHMTSLRASSFASISMTAQIMPPALRQPMLTIGR